VLLDIRALDVGWAQAQELRALVHRLRRAGKRTFAYLHTPHARAYYVAAAAEQVLADPDGGLEARRPGSAGALPPRFLDLLGIGPEFVRIAEYKSAPETLTEKHATKRPQPCARRSSTSSSANSSTGWPRTATRPPPSSARSSTKDPSPEPERWPPVGRSAGLARRAQGGRPAQRPRRARRAAVLRRAPDRWPVGSALAVIVIEGDIVAGKSRDLPLLAGTPPATRPFIAALDWARASKQVRAIVLRVNSPGGSAVASAHLWRAVRRARQVKPVVVSLADVAASGGYYAACGGDVILAEPATLTGSIGIFGGKLNFSGLMAKLGVTSESSARGKNALLSAFDRPYSQEERTHLLSRLRHHYGRFIEAVAKGRGLRPGEVEAVARGRRLDRIAGAGRRLVDAQGGLLDAIEEAKRRSGIPARLRVPLYVLPQPRQTLVQRALRLLGGDSRIRIELPPAAAKALRPCRHRSSPPKTASR